MLAFSASFWLSDMASGTVVQRWAGVRMVRYPFGRKVSLLDVGPVEAHVAVDLEPLGGGVPDRGGPQEPVRQLQSVHRTCRA